MSQTLGIIWITNNFDDFESERHEATIRNDIQICEVHILRDFLQLFAQPNKPILKPSSFKVTFPEVIMIANVFTPQKHQIL